MTEHEAATGLPPHLPPQWAERTLAVVGGKVNAENLRLLHAWAQAEGGNAAANPLNTKFDLPGAVDYNSVGVKSYPRATWGVCATALTLTNGNYGGILGDLQGGLKTAEQIVGDRRTQFSLWGTSPDLILQILSS